MIKKAYRITERDHLLLLWSLTRKERIWVRLSANSELSLKEAGHWLLKTEEYQNCEIIASIHLEDCIVQRLKFVPTIEDLS